MVLWEVLGSDVSRETSLYECRRDSISFTVSTTCADFCLVLPAADENDSARSESRPGARRRGEPKSAARGSAKIEG